MKNEAIYTLNHYFAKESNVISYLGEKKNINLLLDCFKYGKIIPNDAPDLVVVKDNVAIIVEHFEFDASAVNRKGSLGRVEQSRIKREYEKIELTKNSLIYHSEIKAQSSYQNYVKNITRNFLDHYQRISVYKKNMESTNIIEPEMNVKVMFLIDDVSPIGCFAFDENNSEDCPIPVVLAKCPEFLSLMEQCSDLDYALCCSHGGEREFVWFIDNEQISIYKEKQCDYKKMQFLGGSNSYVNIGEFLVSKNKEFL